MSKTSSKHEGAILLKEFLGRRNWSSTKETLAELVRITEKYTTLKKDFLARDDITQELFYTFEEYDNPLKTDSTLETIFSIEKGLEQMPNGDDVLMMSKDNLQKLVMLYSTLQWSAEQQSIIYLGRYNKYKQASGFLQEVLIKEKSEERRAEYLKKMDAVTNAYESVVPERDKKLEEIEKERKEKVEAKILEATQLLNDNEITSIEKRSMIKSLEEKYNGLSDDIHDRYDIIGSETKSKAVAEAKLALEATKKNSVISEISLGAVYNEFEQKIEILNQAYLYFSKSKDTLVGFQFNLKNIVDNSSQ